MPWLKNGTHFPEARFTKPKLFFRSDPVPSFVDDFSLPKGKRPQVVTNSYFNESQKKVNNAEGVLLGFFPGEGVSFRDK
ncbi:MAG: hypothetical protein HY202_04575 [Nitrospirae bacterium]|nr:hypothetical protein [Nitrospirota bacterium]